MGTPHFSCPVLQKLLDDKEFEIVAIYTREPQIAGRGHKLKNSPIHDLALKYNLKIITPKTLRKSDIQQEFANFKADAAVVVAYGLILPRQILEATKYGCINIHPSLLPRWRGPSPIQYSLFAGDETSGVTIIKMDEGIDSGDILAQTSFALEKNANYADLSQKLALIGSKMLIDILKKLPNQQIKMIAQDHNFATFTKKIKKNDCLIDWNLSAIEIDRKIRALNGSLTAFFEYKGEKFKVFAAEIVDLKAKIKNNGEIVDEKFTFQCQEGLIRPLILQRQGKNIVKIDEFLRGFKI